MYQGRTSRYYFDKDNNIDKIFDFVNKRIKVSVPALLIKNKDDKQKLKYNFKVISTQNRGMNQYQDINVLIYFASLNNNPDIIGCLEDIGINSDMLFQEYLEGIEQSLYRSSARNPDDDRVIDVYVPSNDVADGLVERLKHDNTVTHECLNIFSKGKTKKQLVIDSAIEQAIEIGFIDAKRFSALGLTKMQVTRYKDSLIAGLLDSGF